MSRKDFELIAQALQDSHGAEPSVIAQTMAAALAGTNTAFDRDRFLRACLPGANVKARS